MITCFFCPYLIPPLCFSKVILLAKILAPPGTWPGMYKHPNKRWEICQATAGSSATSRVRNVWKRRCSWCDFLRCTLLFWISMCDISICFWICVTKFFFPSGFQIMPSNDYQHSLSRTWQSCFASGWPATENSCSHWATGWLRLVVGWHLSKSRQSDQSRSSKYPKVGVNHQDQALRRNWFDRYSCHSFQFFQINNW